MLIKTNLAKYFFSLYCDFLAWINGVQTIDNNNNNHNNIFIIRRFRSLLAQKTLVYEDRWEHCMTWRHIGRSIKTLMYGQGYYSQTLYFVAYTSPFIYMYVENMKICPQLHINDEKWPVILTLCMYIQNYSQLQVGFYRLKRYSFLFVCKTLTVIL